MLSEFMVAGVINGMREEETIRAKSEKQAWFFFAKKHSFRIRDFKVLRETLVDVEPKEVITTVDRNIQLSIWDGI